MPVDHDRAHAYTTGVADQLGAAVAAGDPTAANAIVDQVAADGHGQFAADLNVALTKTSLADDGTDQLGTVETYAIWLVETGIDESVSADLNEGGDPISKAGGDVSDDEWRDARSLARRFAAWVRANPSTVIAFAQDLT